MAKSLVIERKYISSKQFLSLSIGECIAFCNQKLFTTKEWTEEQYTKAMKGWWRHNKNEGKKPNEDILQVINSVFGS